MICSASSNLAGSLTIGSINIVPVVVAVRYKTAALTDAMPTPMGIIIKGSSVPLAPRKTRVMPTAIKIILPIAIMGSPVTIVATP